MINGMEIIGGLIVSIILLMMSEKKAVQHTLYGGVVAPLEEKKNDIDWFNLRDGYRLIEVGDKITYKITSYALNSSKECITLFSRINESTEACTLYFTPSEDMRAKYPSMRTDGQRFIRALSNATGKTLETLIDVDEAMIEATSKLNRTLVLDMEKAQYMKQASEHDEGEKVIYPSLKLRWVPTGGDE